MSVEQKVTAINRYLRYHTEYRVTIELCALYGLISLKLTREGKTVKMWIGQTLEKRLDEVLQYLDISIGSE